PWTDRRRSAGGSGADPRADGAHHPGLCPDVRHRVRRAFRRDGAALMDRTLRLVAPVAIGAVFLAAWEAVVRLRGIPPYILPAPSAVAQSLWVDGPSLLSSLLVTLRITLAALAAAALIGGAIALLFSLSRVLELSLFPYTVILQVTPIVAIAPLIIIWVR